MKSLFRNIFVSSVFLGVLFAGAAEAALKPIAKDPYVGAIVVDCSTGKVIFEDHADVPAYPASVLKIMDLLMIVEYVEQGKTSLEEKIKVTAEAAKTGGSQVYLKEHEEFVLDEMLYAMMIQSANDVAVALAIRYGGGKEAFVGLMNNRARELGMADTVFRSVHGLPPSTGQKPDVTTARDMARLGMEVVKHPLALKYTSTKEKGFRNNSFQMRTHNNLLGVVEGCDGLKTGYYTAAGFSIVATAERGGRRIVAAVLGSTSKTVRDTKAKELIASAFLNLPPLEEVKVPEKVEEPAAEADQVKKPDEGKKSSSISKGTVIMGVIAVAAVLVLLAATRSIMKRKFSKYDF
jgi:D-alanyl-D-alanine carboxypeptidase (penicillin-binding protein 5/6)